MGYLNDPTGIIRGSKCNQYQHTEGIFSRHDNSRDTVGGVQDYSIFKV